jgi:hypothetical protein
MLAGERQKDEQETEVAKGETLQTRALLWLSSYHILTLVFILF